MLEQKIDQFWLTYHSSLGCSFHSDFGIWIDLEAGVKDSIRDLIAQLVWVALTDRLGGEVEMSSFVSVHLFAQLRVFKN